MSDAKFDIIFRGDIVVGHSIVDVKQRLVQLFKTDIGKINELFTGKAIPLKRGLDQATAEKYQKVLIQAGAQVSLLQTEGVPAKIAAPPTKPAPSALHKPAATQPTSLKERLAQSEAQAAAQAAAKATQKAAAALVSESANLQQGEGGGLSLAPVGAILGSGKVAVAAQALPNISNLSLRPLAGNLLDQAERKVMPPVTVNVSDMTLAEVGANLLNEADRNEIPLPQLDFSDFDLAEVGSDLLSGSEKATVPNVDINTDQLKLAPVGSDMGGIKRSPPPPPPDISGLSLAD